MSQTKANPSHRYCVLYYPLRINHATVLPASAIRLDVVRRSVDISLYIYHGMYRYCTGITLRISHATRQRY
jgi:hypothetical protein